MGKRFVLIDRCSIKGGKKATSFSRLVSIHIRDAQKVTSFDVRLVNPLDVSRAHAIKMYRRDKTVAVEKRNRRAIMPRIATLSTTRALCVCVCLRARHK